MDTISYLADIKLLSDREQSASCGEARSAEPGLAAARQAVGPGGTWVAPGWPLGQAGPPGRGSWESFCVIWDTASVFRVHALASDPVRFYTAGLFVFI